MSNELIFLLTAILDLSFVLLFFQLGRRGLFATVIVNVILITTFGGKLIPIFGLVTNVGNVFYASIFLAVNMMVERFGIREGQKAIWAGFGSLVVFMLMSQFVIMSQPAPESVTIDKAISALFQLTPRISFASMFAYLIAQHLNLWLFGWLRTVAKLSLGLRNLISVSVAQLIDSLLFFFLAFFGTISNQALWETIGTGYLIKVAIAAFSIPFLYASLKIRLESDNQLTEQPQSQKKLPTKIIWERIVLVKVLAVLVSAIGALVMGGWIFNIPVLTYLIPGFVTMKFSTSISFFCAGLLLYFIAESFVGKKNLSSIMIPAMTLVIMLFMSILFLGTIFGVETGIEGFVIREKLVAGSKFVAGVPSFMTMTGFVLVSIVGLFTLGNVSILHKRYRRIGVVLSFIGLIALLGYATGRPTLYYEFGQTFSGMAIHTAALFVLLGMGFFTLGFSKK